MIKKDMNKERLKEGKGIKREIKKKDKKVERKKRVNNRSRKMGLIRRKGGGGGHFKEGEGKEESEEGK